MAFFNDSFLARRRQEWLRSIHAVDIRVSSSQKGSGNWVRGEINQKKIEGDKLVIMATFPSLDSQQWYIQGVQLTEVTGEIAAISYKEAVKQKGQGTMVKIEFPIYEVTG